MDEPRFPYIDWICDNCGDLLNAQEGFNDHKYIWKCQKCGYKNSISRDNIKLGPTIGVRIFAYTMGILRSASIYAILIQLLSHFIFHNELGLFSKPCFWLASVYPLLAILSAYFEKHSVYYNIEFGYIQLILGYPFSDLKRPFVKVIQNIIYLPNKLICAGKAEIGHTRLEWFVEFVAHLLILSGFIIFVHWSICTKWQDWATWFAIVLNYAKNIIGTADGTLLRQRIVIIYYISINILTFSLFFVDKQRAVRRQWRISEFTLLAFSTLGGAFGGTIAMLIFRHKIKNSVFKVGELLLIILHFFIIFLLLVFL